MAEMGFALIFASKFITAQQDSKQINDRPYQPESSEMRQRQ